MSNIDIINQVFDSGINDDNKEEASNTVSETLKSLDCGKIRVAEPGHDGNWSVNEWAKKAILLSFKLNQNKCIETNYTKFYDKEDSKILYLSFQRAI